MSPKQKLAAKVGAAVVALAVPMITFYEGTVLSGYRDPIGIVTACTGHTETAQLGRVYGREECEELLYRDVLKHADDLACVTVDLPPQPAAAFLSFTFNVGRAKFCGSTLVRKANAGDLAGACAELLRWTYAGGKQLPGLVKRRRAEHDLCMQGVTP